MVYFILILSIIVTISLFRDVIKGYNNHDGYRENNLYSHKVFGLVIFIAILIVSILKIFGYEVD